MALSNSFDKYGRMLTAQGKRKINSLDKFILGSHKLYPFLMNTSERQALRSEMKSISLVLRSSYKNLN